jgi:hypothetical protein
MSTCELVELEREEDIKFAKMSIDRYHAQGAPRGGAAARRHRFFAWVCDGYICAVAWLHDNTPFRYIAERFRIGHENSYFIRRICKTCPGDYLVDFLNAIAERLKAEGKECIWTLGLDDHSNALYKRAGFVELGKTPRTRHPVFMRWLRGE